MANYHFHFQQHEEGHREDVRSPSTLSAPVVSPYIAMLHAEPDYQHRTPAPQLSLLAGHYEPGSLRRVRPTRAPHVATIAVRPSEPRRHPQLSSSHSTSNCRSRSHRRRRTRRSRSSSSRSFRRRARSRCPSRRSNATRATHTTATEISPISSAVYPENPQFPANAWLTPPSSFIGNAVTPKHHQKLSLLCSHHTTHDHKSSHPRHHLSLQPHFE